MTEYLGIEDLRDSELMRFQKLEDQGTMKIRVSPTFDQPERASA